MPILSASQPMPNEESDDADSPTDNRNVHGVPRLHARDKLRSAPCWTGGAVRTCWACRIGGLSWPHAGPERAGSAVGFWRFVL